jgi:hypothetical protein
MNDRNIAMWCGPNDGGIKRGDRADTGDLEARPTEDASEEGSGVPGGYGGSTGHPTADPDSLAEPKEVIAIHPVDEIKPDGWIDDLSIKDAGDPSLGLTGVPSHLAEDWTADTDGPQSAEDELGDELPPETGSCET